MIANWDMDTVAKATCGTLYGNNLRFGAISSDSRNDSSNYLFVAIKGNRFDGHNYIATASANGAVGALTQELGDYGLPYVTVENSIQALGLLGGYNRERSLAKIIGVTGSCGKTSICKMLAGIFYLKHKRAQVHTTQANHNNEIGVAQTLLGLTSTHKIALVEMGIRNQGDMAWLSKITRPTTGLISCIGHAHLELLGSLAGVAEEKSDIYHQNTEYAICRAADKAKHQLFSRLTVNTQALTFGLKEEGADAYLQHCYSSAAFASAKLTLPKIAGKDKVTINIQMQTGGTHTLENAAASALAAWVNGVSTECIVKGLADFTPPSNRQQQIELNRITLIDDSYNANPTSMYAALENLANYSQPTIAVLGDMLELGKQSRLLHAQLGEYAAELGIAKLFTIGNNARLIGQQYASKAAATNSWQHFTNSNTLVSTIIKQVQPGSSILIKASRSMQLEIVVEKLIKHYKTLKPKPPITNQLEG